MHPQCLTLTSRIADRHFGVPDYVEQDKALIAERIDVAKKTPWSHVEKLLVKQDGELEPVFSPTIIKANPEYGDHPTQLEDEPDSGDLLRQPSFDWRLLKGNYCSLPFLKVTGLIEAHLFSLLGSC